MYLPHRLRLTRLPAYGQLLALGKERKDPIFLDRGCCCIASYYPVPPRRADQILVVGYDLRKAIYDGFPRDTVIASDLHPGRVSVFFRP